MKPLRYAIGSARKRASKARPSPRGLPGSRTWEWLLPSPCCLELLGSSQSLPSGCLWSFGCEDHEPIGDGPDVVRTRARWASPHYGVSKNARFVTGAPLNFRIARDRRCLSAAPVVGSPLRRLSRPRTSAGVN